MRCSCRIVLSLLVLVLSPVVLASNCLPSERYARELLVAFEQKDIKNVATLNEQINTQCPSASDLQTVADAATLFLALNSRNKFSGAKAAYERLLMHDFSLLPANQQAAYYPLMVRYLLHAGNYKQALILTHILTAEVAANLSIEDPASIQLSIAEIHYEIEFYQSVRELLVPLLAHPVRHIRVRAAALLWHVPQDQQQLDLALQVLKEYQELPDTLVKLNALSLLTRQALEEDKQAQADSYLQQVLALASELDANAALIRLYLLDLSASESTMAAEQLLRFAPEQLTLKERLAAVNTEIAQLTASGDWQQATQKLKQAMTLSENIARNNALAREYASYQLVDQARQLEQAQQQARLQSLAVEKQKQQRLIYILALVSALLGLLVLGLLFIKKRKAAEHYEKLANTDGLTQVLNRRAIQQFAEQVKAHCQQQHQPFVVAIADIDHFKSINDTYGHDAGDVVLTEFAHRANALIRQQDRLGRWGGEEWLIIMTNTSIEAVNGLFKRMQADIHNISAGEHDLKITFSMGAVPGNGEQSIESLIHAADELLYKAKHNGRNQLCLPEVTAGP